MKKIILILLTLNIFFLTFSCLAKGQEKVSNEFDLAFFKKFNDEKLIENLTKGIDNNLDLKIAALKVKESEKIVKLSLGAELPSVNFEGLLGRTFSSSDLYRGSNNFMIHSYHQTRFLLPLNYSYEIDLWGKNRLKTKAKNEQLKIIKENEKTAYILLSSAISADYYNLIKIDKTLALEKEMFDLTTNLYNMVLNKQTIGLASEFDVLELKENLVQIEAKINDLAKRKEILENQLAYLTADKFFSKIERSSFEEINLINNIPDSLESNVVLNRPDVKKAAYNILKNDYEAKIAKRELLPSFTIMGTLGFNGYTSLSNLFKSGTGLGDFWIVPNLDIIDGNRKYNLMKLRKLELDSAKQEYEKAVLASLKEVNDALFQLKTQDKNYKLTKDILNIQNKKLELKEINKTHGLANEIDCIMFKQAQIIAQEKFVDEKINQIVSSINLYKSLGGLDYTNNNFTTNL